MVFTKRLLLGWVMSLYDPMGLLSPLLIKLKIELRCLFSSEYGNLEWDDPLLVEAHQAWEKLIAEFLSIPEICIRRDVRPTSVLGSPEIFAFFDGSFSAYACSVYV